jgi:hypothetical protein
MTSTLVEKIGALADAFGAASIPHAFGGALALAYATEEPRGTRDIDVNVFVGAEEVDAVFAALPGEVQRTDADVATVRRDEQVRLLWDDTPLDLFFSAGPAQRVAASRTRDVEFSGRRISVLAPEDLVVFKMLFDRSKDWVDIEAMLESGTVDVAAAIESVTPLLGDDDRIERLRHLGDRLHDQDRQDR